MATGTDDSEPEVQEVEALEKSSDSQVSKELAAIRQRRTQDTSNRFPSATEDFVLLFGLGYGLLFMGALLAMGAGIFGESTALDHGASSTFLDIGDQCLDTSNQAWFHIYPITDDTVIVVNGYNFAEGVQSFNWTATGKGETSDPSPNTNERSGVSDRIDFSTWSDGEYDLLLRIDVYADESDKENGTKSETLSKTIIAEISSSTNGLTFLPFVDGEISQEASITDEGTRSCWSVTDLGNWGWVLMGAELGGGRETAMLTGGAAGIPAWWMAYVSLSLSVISLFLAYPVMYKVYHQDSDDMLSRSHINEVVNQVLKNTENRLRIKVDWDLFKAEVRDLSIDIMVPYHNTEDTLTDLSEVRSEILKETLDEFAIFHVFKPVQLTVRSIGDNQAIDFETGVGVGSGMVDGEPDDGPQDYTSFFKDLHVLSQIEDEVRDSIKDFFKIESNLLLQMATVTSEDRVIFVRVAYKPTQRFAFFRFKQTTEDVIKQLKKYIEKENPDLTGTHELVVRGRNIISTLADRSGAGRVETHATGNAKDSRVAAVAKQDGFGGRVLQTKLFGDILSTVEYTANEKREMINKYGFWGLMVFVWIPFMASGVLVGAMLGLLSRMRFMRVLWATFVGGAAASLTWAYTAEGIITVMHKYKLEAAIPIAIAAFVLMAILHMRSTKNRRLAELFEDTLLDSFHADIQDKYGGNQS
jgi:hypothetical protein